MPEPRAPVTVLRSVSGTPDWRRLLKWSVLLLDKQVVAGVGGSVPTVKRCCDEIPDYYHTITSLFFFLFVNRCRWGLKWFTLHEYSRCSFFPFGSLCSCLPNYSFFFPKCMTTAELELSVFQCFAEALVRCYHALPADYSKNSHRQGFTGPHAASHTHAKTHTHRHSWKRASQDSPFFFLQVLWDSGMLDGVLCCVCVCFDSQHSWCLSLELQI